MYIRLVFFIAHILTGLNRWFHYAPDWKIPGRAAGFAACFCAGAALAEWLVDEGCINCWKRAGTNEETRNFYFGQIILFLIIFQFFFNSHFYNLFYILLYYLITNFANNFSSIGGF
jgi:hypothetical protein